MLRLWISVLMLLLGQPALATEYDDPLNRLPIRYWEYMDGYKYQYAEDCTVAWHVRTSSFLIPTGGRCPELSDEKLKADAIKSIEYAQAKSSAKNFYEYYEEIEPTRTPYTIDQSRADARALWSQSCLDAKTLRGVTPFNELSARYPGIDTIHAARLFSSARDLVKGLGGVLNCEEYAQYAVEMYASDIDIRVNK